MKRRLVYFTLSFLCFVLCYLIVKLFSGNQFIRGFSGDIIIVLLIYFFIKGFYDFQEIKLAFFTLAIAFTTEILQYFNLTTYLGLENNTMAQLILGSVFDPYDLIAYGIGAILVFIIDARIIRKTILNTKTN